MSDFPDIPPDKGVPLLDLTTLLFSDAVMDALDAAIGTGGGGIPESTVDAKGDLIVATAADAVARLPVGTNGYVLTADSAEASGLKWAAGGGGGGGGTGDVQFSVARASGSTSLASGAFTTYPLDGTPSVNVGGGSWNAGTYIYTIPETGLYLCLGGVRIADSSAARNLAVGIGVSNADGAHVLWGPIGGSAEASRYARQYTRLTRFTAGDLVRLYIYSDGATFPTQAVGGEAHGQFMSLIKLAD